MRFYATTDGHGNWIVIDRLTETVIDTATSGRNAFTKVEALNKDHQPTVTEVVDILDQVWEQDRNGKRELVWVLTVETYTVDWEGNRRKDVMSFNSSSNGYRGQVRSHYSEGVA